MQLISSNTNHQFPAIKFQKLIFSNKFASIHFKQSISSNQCPAISFLQVISSKKFPAIYFQQSNCSNQFQAINLQQSIWQQSGGASQWRVWYQWGLPRLVLFMATNKIYCWTMLVAIGYRELNLLATTVEFHSTEYKFYICVVHSTRVR